MLIAALAVVLGFGVLACSMIFRQEKMIYFPRAYTPAEMRYFDQAGTSKLSFTTAEGRQTAFWLPPAAQGSQDLPFIWLVFPGNGGRALDYLDVARAGPDECGWLFVDYPGYGACEGSPTPESIRKNALGAIEALATVLERPVAELVPHIGSFGHSIGAAAALDIAAVTGMKRAVAVSPFTSMKAMAARFVTPLLTRFLRHRFDNDVSLQRLAQKGASVAIFHGTVDSAIPISMGKKLAADYPDIVSFTPIEGAGHNDIIGVGMDEITAALVP